jgi:hypothetical protein
LAADDYRDQQRIELVALSECAHLAAHLGPDSGRERPAVEDARRLVVA